MTNLSTEEMRVYTNAYRAKRRAWARDELGGQCVICGSTTGLEFDHVDPKTKVNCISNMMGAPWDQFVAEVRKCQLLCVTHHQEKTRREGPPRATHGSYTYYCKYGCRCDECRNAMRAYRKRRQAGVE